MTSTKPGSLSANTTHTFTAPSGSELAASTTYLVVITNADGGDTITFNTTDSHNEDANPAEGWKIANGYRFRSSTTWSGSTATILKIRVNGAAVTGVESIAITSTPPASPGGTYFKGDKITFKVTFTNTLQLFERGTEGGRRDRAESTSQ